MDIGRGGSWAGRKRGRWAKPAVFYVNQEEDSLGTREGPGPAFISLSVHRQLGWDFHFWWLRVTISPCYRYLLCHFRKCRKIAVQFFQICVYKSVTPHLNPSLLWCDMKRKGSPHGLFPNEIRRKWVNTPSISQGIMKHIKYYLRIIFTITMFVFHQALGQLPWFVNGMSPCRQAVHF